MSRPRTPIGTFGQIEFKTMPGDQVRARTRFRDVDGQLRRVEATAATKKAAEHALKTRLAERDDFTTGSGDLTAGSSFGQLVDVWLGDLDLEGRLAPSSRALYERNMRKLVLPAFEHFALREITVRRVDQFIKQLSATKSHSKARQARTVLSLAARTGGAIRRTPGEPGAGCRSAAEGPHASDGPDGRAGQRDPDGSAVLAPGRGPFRSETRWSVGTDHRGDARHVGPHRGSARDPQVRRGRHPLPSDCAHLRHDRLARG